MHVLVCPCVAATPQAQHTDRDARPRLGGGDGGGRPGTVVLWKKKRNSTESLLSPP